MVVGERAGVSLSRYGLLVLVLLPLVFSALVLVISLRTNERTVGTAVDAERSARRQSELAFCQLVVLLDDVYKTTPPPTETGRQVAMAISNLRVANHCP